MCLLEQQQLNHLPIKATDIQRETSIDPVLSKVFNFTVRGWPLSVGLVLNEVKPFYNKRFDLTVFNGCLLLGLKVVIPQKYQQAVLELLHEGHPGMSRMKSLARLHVWWPSIISDTEKTVQACTNCAVVAKDPTRVPLHSWEFPRKPWQRLHLDYAGPFRGKMWLILIDAYSKWPEIHAMSVTTAQATIQQLRKIFAVHGLPERLITDNGPRFVASEFESFCQTRRIHHTRTAPYHPRLNGEAERLVETFKLAINKADPKNATQLDDAVINFLAKYRTIPHTITNCSPSELLNGRRLRTTLDLLHPCQPDMDKARERQRKNYDAHTTPRHFSPGDTVWVCNFCQGPRWVAGSIKANIGRVMFKVEIEGKDMIWRRHANQLRTRLASLPFTMNTDSEHPQDNPASTTSHTTQTPVLRRSNRVRRPRQMWVST